MNKKGFSKSEEHEDNQPNVTDFPIRSENKIRILSASPRLGEPRRRPSSWDDSDDEMPSQSVRESTTKSSRIYSADSKKQTTGSVVTEIEEIKRRYFQSVKNKENIELEPRVNEYTIDRRQSPARVRRRSKGSRSSSPGSEINNLENQLNIIDDEKVEEVNESCINFSEELSPEIELDLESKTFLETFFSDLRGRRMRAIVLDDKTTNDVDRMEDMATDSEDFQNLDSNYIGTPDSAYYWRTSRKLSQILEIEEIKDKGVDDCEVTTSKNEDATVPEDEPLFTDIALCPVPELNKECPEDIEENTTPLPTARDKPSSLMSDPTSKKLFSIPESLGKSKNGSCSERCNRNVRFEFSNESTGMTPKSAKTVIGLSESLENELTSTKEHKVPSIWLESPDGENESQKLLENLKLNLNLNEEAGTSPRKSELTSYRSDDARSRSSRSSRYQVDSPKFRLNFYKDSDRSLNVEDVKTPNTTAPAWENPEDGNTSSHSSSSSLSSILEEAKSSDEKINNSKKSTQVPEETNPNVKSIYQKEVICYSAKGRPKKASQKNESQNQQDCRKKLEDTSDGEDERKFTLSVDTKTEIVREVLLSQITENRSGNSEISADDSKQLQDKEAECWSQSPKCNFEPNLCFSVSVNSPKFPKSLEKLEYSHRCEEVTVSRPGSSNEHLNGNKSSSRSITKAGKKSEVMEHKNTVHRTSNNERTENANPPRKSLTYNENVSENGLNKMGSHSSRIKSGKDVFKRSPIKENDEIKISQTYNSKKSSKTNKTEFLSRTCSQSTSPCSSKVSSAREQTVQFDCFIPKGKKDVAKSHEHLEKENTTNRSYDDTIYNDTSCNDINQSLGRKGGNNKTVLNSARSSNHKIPSVKENGIKGNQTTRSSAASLSRPVNSCREVFEDHVVEGDKQQESKETKGSSKTDRSLPSVGSEDPEEWKRDKATLEEELWNDLIEAFDGGSDGSGKSSIIFPSTRLRKSCRLIKTTPKTTATYPLRDNENDGDSEDDSDGDCSDGLEHDSFTLSRRIIETEESAKRMLKKSGIIIENTEGGIKREMQTGELVAENVTPKDENSKVAQHSKETFYVDVLDDRNNLWIGEFGDVTCCNLGKYVITESEKPKDHGDGDVNPKEEFRFCQLTETKRSKENKIQRQLWTDCKSPIVKEAYSESPEKFLLSSYMKKSMSTESIEEAQAERADSVRNEITTICERIISPRWGEGTSTNRSKTIMESTARDTSSSESIKYSTTTEDMLQQMSSKTETETLPETETTKSNLKSSNCSLSEDVSTVRSREEKESANVSIFLTRKGRGTNHKSGGSQWLIVKNSREKNGGRKGKKGEKINFPAELFRSTALFEHDRTSSVTLIKLRKSDCFQNFYKRLISLFCLTSGSASATSK
ncbi:hypothetical protein RUM44_005926 [Polyplax serrata]|uniref:Uncharacterized protein n=1 Tax=Polyplax serrata TaxID=468196 RepID=A0ABR1AYG7_POLSC